MPELGTSGSVGAPGGDSWGDPARNRSAGKTKAGQTPGLVPFLKNKLRCAFGDAYVVEREDFIPPGRSGHKLNDQICRGRRYIIGEVRKLTG
jgi:hypothetical protein